MEQLKQSLVDYKKTKDKIKLLEAEVRDLKESISGLPEQFADEMTKFGVNTIGIEGVGKFNLKMKTNVFFPSKENLEDREKLLNYLRERLGKDGVLSRISINYSFLTSFYQEERDLERIKPEESLPGTKLTIKPTISITKK